MTTDRQVAANRENAKKSTGPRTKKGKHRSRRNALRHGLTAETVIEVLEDPATYRALARAINVDYRPATNLERELMARLVSLLWRLRRATTIESGLMALQGQAANQHSDKLEIFYRLLAHDQGGDDLALDAQHSTLDTKKVARSFLKLMTSSGLTFERLGRYETRLWRQLLQVIFVLNNVSRRHKIGCLENGRLQEGLWPPIEQLT